jgi:hypothetical protein
MRNESQRHRHSPKSPATSSTQPHSAVTHAEDPGERMKTSNRWRVGHHLARADCHAQSRHAAVDPNHPGSDAPKIAFARCSARPCCVGFRESARRWYPTREIRFDQTPTHRIIAVAFWKRPHRMQMLRQHDPSDDLERIRLANITHDLPQIIDPVHQQATRPFRQVDREETRA